MATELIRINGWDNNWTGALGSINEYVSAADGLVISTTVVNRTVTLDFLDVSTIVDADTVSNVAVTIRHKASKIGGQFEPPWQYLQVKLIIDAVNQGAQTTANVGTSFVNSQLTKSTWNSDWTVAQLNNMQLEVTSKRDFVGTSDTWFIDCVTITITYTNPPIKVFPAKALLNLTGKAVSIKRVDKVKPPKCLSFALTGKAPTLKFAYRINVSTRALALLGRTPKIVVNSIRTPAKLSAALTGAAPTLITNDLRSPAIATLALTGLVPIPDPTDNHWTATPTGLLTAETEQPAAIRGTEVVVVPPRVRLQSLGYGPTADPTENQFAAPGVESLLLTGKIPSTANSGIPKPAIYALALTGKAPSASLGYPLVVGVGTLTLLGDAPVLGPYKGTLVLAPTTPIILVDHLVQPGAATVLSLQGLEAFSLVGAVRPYTGSIILTGSVPTLRFTSFFSRAETKLVSLTTKHVFNHVSTPEDILIG